MVATADSPSRSARILIVDDDTVLLEALPETLSLRLWRVDVEWTDSPQEALHRVQQKPYDIIMTDFKMPQMDGLTLLRALKQLVPEASVLMMTAYGEEELATQATESGAACLINKPIDRDNLTAVLKHVLKSRAEKKE